MLCGIDIAKRVFELVGGDFAMDIRIHDGEQVKKGDIIATMTGSTKTLLKGERTALNILQHMSGIATATHQCVELVAGTNAQITDTRKTLPGLRPLQKYAVTVGGGKNHRYNLSDGAMLKDNHIDAYGGITPAVAALRKKIGHMVKIEVGVRTLEELEEALSAGADIIMLDNMSCEDMTKAVQRVDGKVLLEIKAPGAVPLWLAHILGELDVFPTGFSKYGVCYRDNILEKYINGVITCV